jgi:hypothetical protein
MGQAQFKATDAAVGRGIDVTRGAGESLVRTQVESFKDPVWVYGMATVMGLMALGIISFMVFGYTANRCQKKPESQRKRCKTRGGGWGLVFMLLALTTYLIVKVAHMVRNPAASAQLLGARAAGSALGQVF